MSIDRQHPRGMGRWLRWLPIVATATFVAIPISASIQYALFPGGSLSFAAYAVLVEDPTLAAAAARSIAVTALTIVVLILALVPAVVAIHLWAPRLRPVFDVLCTLPLIVPPIALAAGVIALLRWGTQQGRGSTPSRISLALQNPEMPLVLVGTYVVLCLPFTYRSIDAGLRTIELKAIVEASTTLGSSLFGTLWRVVIPNIRGPVLYSIFFATAVCLSEFAIAATLSKETIAVWLFTVSSTDFRTSVAVAVLLNILTWSLLIGATFIARRFSAAETQTAGAIAPAPMPASSTEAS